MCSKAYPTIQTKDKVGMIRRLISKIHACFKLKHEGKYTLKQIIKKTLIAALTVVFLALPWGSLSLLLFTTLRLNECLDS